MERQTDGHSRPMTVINRHNLGLWQEQIDRKTRKTQPELGRNRWRDQLGTLAVTY